MKQIVKRFAEHSFRLMALMGGAVFFAFLFWSFTGHQTAGEKLLGLTFDDEKKEVTIKVTSTGCTDKNYFQFKVRGSVIEIIRTKRDECKRMPFATSITFTMAETGIAPGKVYTIKNKFIASPGIVLVQ
jgi:hypothetical protein